jgi:hypothetical protein
VDLVERAIQECLYRHMSFNLAAGGDNIAMHLPRGTFIDLMARTGNACFPATAFQYSSLLIPHQTWQKLSA